MSIHIDEFSSLYYSVYVETWSIIIIKCLRVKKIINLEVAVY